MEIPLAIGFVVMFFMYRNLKGRVSNIERHLAEKKTVAPPAVQVPVAPPAGVGFSQHQVAAPLSAVAHATPVVKEFAVPNDSGGFGAWLKEDWLLKLGAFLLLLGFGWLASYAFINGWIGPAGRITLGIVLGTLIMALGYWRMQKHPAQGAVFLVLGSTAILLTTYAARELYDFFTPFSALALMFITSTFVALASIVYDRRPLGVASVALAGVAPLLTNSPSTDYIGLFAYLAVVVVGAVLLAALKSHRQVIVTALLVVAAYSLPVLLGLERADRDVLLLFAYGFAFLFYLSNTISLLRIVGTDASSDLFAATGNALLLAAWIVVCVPDTLHSLYFSGIAILFVVGAFVTSFATKRFESFYVYAGIGVAYIAAATAAELDGAALTIAYTIEAGLVSLLTYVLTRNVRVAHKTALLLGGPMLLSLGGIASSSWGRGVIFHEDFFVLAVLTVTLFLLGISLMAASRASNDKQIMSSNGALFVAGSVYSFILLWLSLHELFEEDTAVLLSLVIYTLVGITTYILGAAGEKKSVKTYGAVLLSFVVARLLFIDVWNMELAWRIITFFAIGALLMSTAFFGKRKQVAAPEPPPQTSPMTTLPPPQPPHQP